MASRFGGEPKGLVKVGGRRIVDRVAEALLGGSGVGAGARGGVGGGAGADVDVGVGLRVADELLLIANDPAAGGWLPGVRVAADVRPGLGSLGGIHAALARAGTPVLVVAWDMPFVPAALLAELRARGAGADVVVPESDSKRGLEPMCAWYAPACLAAIERRLDAGDRRVIAFYEDVRVDRMDAATVARFGDPARIFLNVNTPDDLGLAEEHASTTDGGRDRQKA